MWGFQNEKRLNNKSLKEWKADYEPAVWIQAAFFSKWIRSQHHFHFREVMPCPTCCQTGYADRPVLEIVHVGAGAHWVCNQGSIFLALLFSWPLVPFSFGVILEHVPFAVQTRTVKQRLICSKHVFVGGSVEIGIYQNHTNPGMRQWEQASQTLWW